MKIKFLLSAALVLGSITCFSQATNIKQAEQKKANTKPLTAVINPVVKRDSLIRAESRTTSKTATVGPLDKKKEN